MRLARMANTAPGPDGVRYVYLRKIDPGCHMLSAISFTCLKLKLVPNEWKTL